MGRPRKPTHLHLISGSAKKHPDRIAGREAEPSDLGRDLRDTPAPHHLSKPLAKLWDELRTHLHPRVAGQADAIAFEALVRLVARLRSGEAVAADHARLQSYLGAFGLTPASRSNVSQGKPPQQPRGFAALKDQPEGGA
jgi:hypothetical protein